MNINVRISDRGVRSTVQSVFGARNSSVRVGVLGDAAGTPASGASGGITVAELAAIHEFGLGNVPERSFIRSYFDAYGTDVADLFFRLMKEAITQSIRSGTPITPTMQRQILSKVGLFAQGGIQARIANGEIVPPLQARTIARKGSSIPLIDTGQLRSSISYEVDLGQ